MYAEGVHMERESTTAESGARGARRPEPFSTYAPRDLVRRLKVVAALRDEPVWTLVSAAIEEYLERFEREHGRLPRLGDQPGGMGRRE
jgi:hypothetical protein